MQSALSQAFSEPLLAAMPQLSEKLHQGVPSSNPALYLGHEVCKSTTALGLRAALHLERVKSRYTGKERDAESGNDYFGARYYASTMGRFLSPDWSAKVEPVPYAKLDDPQSLNLYAYVGNNPLVRDDEDGHDFGQMAALYAESNQAIQDAEAAAKQPPSTPAQQQIHTETTITVHANTHWWNSVGSWFASKFAAISTVFSRSFGSSGGPRAGKPFTPKGKQEVLQRNAAENGGQNVCENCRQPTVPAQQSQSGVPRPSNESTVDHIHPRSLNGDGDPINGQNLCPTCNGIKSDSLPVMEEPVMPEVPIEIPIFP
jgi:RHS repeat-associated protein